MKRVLVVVFVLSCVNALADDTLVDKIRKAGIPLVAAREYVANVQVFAKYDRNSWTNYDSHRFQHDLNFSQEPEFLAAREKILAFHKQYGDSNPVSDAVNFVRARRQYEEVFGVPEGSAVDLADLRARLAQGEEALLALGKNGIHYQEGSQANLVRRSLLQHLNREHFVFSQWIEILKGKLALKDLVELMDRQGDMKFTDLEQVKKSLQPDSLEKAVLIAEHDEKFAGKVAQERNSLVPERPVALSGVRAGILRELTRIENQEPARAKAESPESLLSTATARYLQSEGIQHPSGTIELKRQGGEWDLPSLQNREAHLELLDRVSDKKTPPVSVGIRYDLKTEEIVEYLGHFGPLVDAAMAMVTSRQNLRNGQTLEAVRAAVLGNAAESIRRIIVEKSNRTNESTYKISAITAAMYVGYGLAELRNQFFEPVEVPAENSPRLAERAPVASDTAPRPPSSTPVNPCNRRGGFWSRLAGNTLQFLGGAR